MSANLAISELAAAVERPIAEAVGLPNRAYTSPECFRLELERIFAPSWACLGHACDVPQPLHHFHRWVAKRLAAAVRPPEPRVRRPARARPSRGIRSGAAPGRHRRRDGRAASDQATASGHRQGARSGAATRIQSFTASA